VNAYAAPLMESYLSDSAGVWRAGEPLAAIGEMHGPVLQVLIHPIWWGPEHAPAAERLDYGEVILSGRLQSALAVVRVSSRILSATWAVVVHILRPRMT